MTGSVVLAPAAANVRRRRLVVRLPAARRHLGIVIGVAILVVLVGASFLAPMPHDPLHPYPGAVLHGPGGEFWFGTDGLGRDVFSRTVTGARLDIPIALLGTMVSAAIGVPIGLMIGNSSSRWADRFMRLLDIVQAFPFLVLAIVLVALLGSSRANLVLAISLIYVPAFIRLVRSEVVTIRRSRFIEAAESIGASRTRILWRHLLPNVTGTILVQASFTAAQSILVIASLSYLGLGVPPPTPSWGGMIQNGSQNITTGEWWVVLFPGLAVFVCVAALNLIADGLDAVLRRDSHG